jgi:hypothetical protein
VPSAQHGGHRQRHPFLGGPAPSRWADTANVRDAAVRCRRSSAARASRSVLVGPPRGAPAQSPAAEQQAPRAAAETRTFEAAHAARCPRALGPAAARRATRGPTAVRLSRHTRAQRANAAPTSCNAPISRTSCSRDSPSTFGHRPARAPRPTRRETIPGEASAASWYQAPLSACNVSSSKARESGAAAWAPGRPAAVWKLRAASANSAAH